MACDLIEWSVLDVYRLQYRGNDSLHSLVKLHRGHDFQTPLEGHKKTHYQQFLLDHINLMRRYAGMDSDTSSAGPSPDCAHTHPPPLPSNPEQPAVHPVATPESQVTGPAGSGLGPVPYDPRQAVEPPPLPQVLQPPPLPVIPPNMSHMYVPFKDLPRASPCTNEMNQNNHGSNYCGPSSAPERRPKGKERDKDKPRREERPPRQPRPGEVINTVNQNQYARAHNQVGYL